MSMTIDPLEGALRLGFASSRAGESPRWSEVSIYRTRDGYTAQRVGRSTIAGERDLPATFSARDPRELVRWFARPGRGGPRVPDVAVAAIDAAAVADPAFAAGLADELDVEQYGAVEPRDGSLVVVLQRDDQARAIRFCGRPIAHSAAPADRGSAVTIFAVDDGTFAVSIVGEDRRDATVTRNRAAVGVDARDVVDAVRFRDGWTRVARRALQAAANADPRFAAGVADLLRKGLPPPATILRDGTAYVRFVGTRIATSTTPTERGSLAVTIFRRLDAGGGYVVGEITRERAGVREAHVVAFTSAADLVRAFRVDRWELLWSAADSDPDVAAALHGATPSPASTETRSRVVVMLRPASATEPIPYVERVLGRALEPEEQTALRSAIAAGAGSIAELADAVEPSCAALAAEIRARSSAAS
jgi:hypothetical protein